MIGSSRDFVDTDMLTIDDGEDTSRLRFPNKEVVIPSGESKMHICKI